MKYHLDILISEQCHKISPAEDQDILSVVLTLVDVFSNIHIPYSISKEKEEIKCKTLQACSFLDTEKRSAEIIYYCKLFA